MTHTSDEYPRAAMAANSSARQGLHQCRTRLQVVQGTWVLVWLGVPLCLFGRTGLRFVRACLGAIVEGLKVLFPVQRKHSVCPVYCTCVASCCLFCRTGGFCLSVRPPTPWLPCKPPPPRPLVQPSLRIVVVRVSLEPLSLCVPVSISWPVNSAPKLSPWNRGRGPDLCSCPCRWTLLRLDLWAGHRRLASGLAFLWFWAKRE